MPHVLLWVMLFAGPSGPVQVLVTSDPFPTLEACQAWDKVPLTIRANLKAVHSESRCVPVQKAPEAPKPEPSPARLDV